MRLIVRNRVRDSQETWFERVFAKNEQTVRSSDFRRRGEWSKHR